MWNLQWEESGSFFGLGIAEGLNLERPFPCFPQPPWITICSTLLFAVRVQIRACCSLTLDRRSLGIHLPNFPAVLHCLPPLPSRIALHIAIRAAQFTYRITVKPKTQQHTELLRPLKVPLKLQTRSQSFWSVMVLQCYAYSSVAWNQDENSWSGGSIHAHLRPSHSFWLFWTLRIALTCQTGMDLSQFQDEL